MEAVVTIDESVYNKATEAAESKGVSVKEFIEEAVREKLRAIHGEARINGVSQPDQSAQVSALDKDRIAFLEELNRLIEEAKERDRLKEGSVGPISREEIYAERLDRFR